MNRRVDSYSSLPTHKSIGITDSSVVIKGTTHTVTSKSKPKVTGAFTNVPRNVIRPAEKQVLSQIIQRAQATEVTNKKKMAADNRLPYLQGASCKDNATSTENVYA